MYDLVEGLYHFRRVIMLPYITAEVSAGAVIRADLTIEKASYSLVLNPENQYRYRQIACNFPEKSRLLKYGVFTISALTRMQFCKHGSVIQPAHPHPSELHYPRKALP